MMVEAADRDGRLPGRFKSRDSAGNGAEELHTPGGKQEMGERDERQGIKGTGTVRFGNSWHKAGKGLLHLRDASGAQNSVRLSGD